MAVNPNMANREVCDCIFLDYKTRKPFLNCDYANTNTVGLTGTNVMAYGGQGRPGRISFSGEKGGTITIETQIAPAKLLSLMTGAEIEKTAKFIAREKLTVGADGAITLTNAAIADTLNVYADNDDCGTPLTATGTDKAYTVTGATEGNEVIAYYWLEKTTGIERLNIKSTTFPKNFVFQGSTYDKTEDDEIVAEKMIAYKCAPQPNMEISRSNTGDPATITVTCDLLADKDNNVLDIIFDEAGI